MGLVNWPRGVLCAQTSEDSGTMCEANLIDTLLIVPVAARRMVLGGRCFTIMRP